MRVSATHFKKLDTGSQQPVPPGMIYIKADRPVTVEANVGGQRIVLGIGDTIKSRINGVQWVRVSPKTAEAVIYWPNPVNHKTEKSEVFTNADRMPMESGTQLAIRQAVRMLAIEQKEAMRSMRREFRKMTRNDVIEDEPETETVVADDEQIAQGDTTSDEQKEE